MNNISSPELSDTGPYHVAGCTNIFESESLAKFSSYLVELSVVQIMLCLTAQT